MSGKIAKTIQTYSDVFDAFSKSKTKQNCFDHNFSKSAPFGPCFGILSQFEALLKMQPFATVGTLSGDAENEKVTFFSYSSFVGISAKVF